MIRNMVRKLNWSLAPFILLLSGCVSTFDIQGHRGARGLAPENTLPAFEKALSEQFESRGALQFHLAPPLLARRAKRTGEPRKMMFGRWMLSVFRLLAKGKPKPKVAVAIARELAGFIWAALRFKAA